MTTVADIVAAADRIAPLAKAAGWDPVGLQLGDMMAAANTVAVCHEVNDAVIDAVIDRGVDTLLAYHPLVFNPMRSFTAGSGSTGRAYRLVREGVSLVVVHTAADVGANGCADSLAEALGLTDVKPFAPLWPSETAKVATFVPAAAVDHVRAAISAAGGGVIGRYTSCSFEIDGRGTFVPGEGASPSSGVVGHVSHDEEVRLEMIAPAGRVDAIVAAMVDAHPYDEAAYDVIPTRSNAGFLGRHGALETTVDELADLVESTLGVKPRVAGSGQVRRVAVMPGSGGDFITAAAAVADAVVTGDVTHHRARTALDRGCAVVDPGHAASERPGVASLYAAVAREFDDVVDLTGIPASPWKEG